jgi:hypothetical protein
MWQTPQRLHGRAQRRQLDEPFEVVDERRIALAQRLAAALASHAAIRQRSLVKIVLAAIDGRTTSDRGERTLKGDCRTLQWQFILIKAERRAVPMLVPSSRRLP